MSKREYIQTNKDWLEAKSKEEGVNALFREAYIIRSSQRERMMASTLRHAVSLPPIIQDGL